MVEDLFKSLLEKKGGPFIVDNNPRLKYQGTQGSFISFVASDFVRNHHVPVLIIYPDAERAIYAQNDIENLTPEIPVLYLPSSAKNIYETESTRNANIIERAEVLSRISQCNGSFVLTSHAEAICEKVISTNSFKEHSFTINRGEKVDITFIEEYLQEYHFVREDFVYEPGQYAIRGGILDVFSFSGEHPYRIELNGDEIESIRSFDPVTQLSEKQFEFAVLFPNLEKDQRTILRISLLEFIPENTRVILVDPPLLSEKIRVYFKKAEEYYLSLPETIQQEPVKLLINEIEFAEHCLKHPIIETGNGKLFSDQEILFQQSPQPVFNKNFDLLLENLSENKSKGFRNLLFTDNAKQHERLQQIFEDIKKQQHLPGDLIEPVLLSIHEGFVDHEAKIACYTDHQIFERYHKYRSKSTQKRTAESLSLKELQNFQPGDFIVHIDHGIGRFAGLEKIDVQGKKQEAVKLIYKDNDVLYVSIHSLHRIARFSGKEGQVPRIDKIGSTHWQTLKQKTKSRVKTVAFDLIKLYAKRKSAKGFSFSPDNYLQTELEASFIYEDTPDQIKTTADVKRDMEKPYPMDRLVCGDVGFGKTEIAIRAAFKAVTDGKQVAVMVPTTILALQHYKTFSERLKDFPCKVDFINRFKSNKEVKQSLEDLSKGKTDIIIGTHKLLGNEVKFKDLGLLIIDEEQKFGVGAKDKLKTLKENVDTLTLTATPIPRTLQFSLMGARDLSVIATAPPNRFPVQTELHTFNEELIRDAITYEIKRGGQVFFIHNRVQNITEIAGLIQRLVPEAKIITGHGKMEGEKLEEVILNFMEGQYDVLISTTIVESGLDIPNANTIIINDAQNFGLSDMHQMRGRVGRSNKKAFCYLLVPSQLTLTNDAKKRLRAITEFSDLGSGFQIAMRDLDIRGAGNLLGGEQSGFINDMGFDTYMKILSEAIEELKEEDWYKKEIGEDQNQNEKATFARTFVKETQLDTDLELLIPDYYIGNAEERLSIYRELDEITKETELLRFENALKDRFGPLPKQVSELIAAIRMRWQAMRLGFEKLILKNGKMIAYFISKPNSPYYSTSIFQSILHYAQMHPANCSLKEQNERFSITISPIKSIGDVSGIFNFIESLIPSEASEEK